MALAAVRTLQAATAGLAGKRSLLAAEREMNPQRLDSARAHLREAEASFTRMRRHIRGLGPLHPVARITPLVRVQLRGVEAFGDAGILVSRAGRQLADVTSELVSPTEGQLPISRALNQLEQVRESLGAGVTALEIAIRRVEALDGYRLLGPLGGARADLSRSLDRIAGRAVSAREGLDAVIAFAGGGGPRRYLLFSQNPDEVRPTGGYMGTYGVLGARSEGLALERYEPTENWTGTHPDAVVPRDQVPSPFRFFDGDRGRQSLANVNATPDWPTVARLAVDVWQRGGEAPVDGVLSATPAFLARVLAVVGPVAIPRFDEVVTAQNVVERFDFYTREFEEATPRGRLRKTFVAELVRAVLDRALSAPPSQWIGLGAALGRSLEAREVMAWSTDKAVTNVLVNRAWDGTLPSLGGDFVYDSEFEYAAKNGRSLQRTFDHHVQLQADGSALITTTLTLTNSEGPRPTNPSSLAYHTLYGPVGATVHDSSDPHGMTEPPINGHPSVGWFRAAPPLGTTTVKVAWQAPGIARHLDDGSWVYGLWFMHLPHHTGDVLNLQVDLPPGARWEGPAPPAQSSLNSDVVGTWRFSGAER